MVGGAGTVHKGCLKATVLQSCCRVVRLYSSTVGLLFSSSANCEPYLHSGFFFVDDIIKTDALVFSILRNYEKNPNIGIQWYLLEFMCIVNTYGFVLRGRRPRNAHPHQCTASPMVPGYIDHGSVGIPTKSKQPSTGHPSTPPAAMMHTRTKKA